VKLIKIREDGKFSLSMKELEQSTGFDMNPARTRKLKGEKEEFVGASSQPLDGLLTGIKQSNFDKKTTKGKKRIASP